MPDPVVPPLNISTFITRVQGLAQQSSTSGGSKRESIAGPVSFQQTIANGLTAIQAWANTISGQITTLFIRTSAITTTGQVSFNAINIKVSVDQIANNLVFKVQYPDGSVKTGTIALI